MSVRMRVYDLGFGECLLLSFPGGHHMLVDCGTLRPEDEPRLREVARDVAEQTGGRLALVVASHRHRDHVSGFRVAAELWREIEVGEVWLPWTENPRDPQALTLRRRADRIARKLASRLSGQLRQLALNCVSDSAALDILDDGFAGRPECRYLEGEGVELDRDPLPGVAVAVLGPRRGARELHNMELQLGAVELGLDAQVAAGGPFEARYKRDRRSGRRLYGVALEGVQLPQRPAAGSEEQLCYWLDGAINDTSLVLLLRCGDVTLLLPGDAQLEGWLPLLESAELREELGRLSCYKVSHHGSEVGTPPRAVEAFGKRLCSVMSAETTGWEQLPHAPLLERLARGRALVTPGRTLGRARSRRGAFWVDVELRG